MPPDEQPTTKTKILESLKTIEERLVEYQHIPEEVKQLRILQTQLHDALKNKQAQEAAWKDAIYRLMKEALSLLFPNNGKHR
jgi:hypothetical protein